ncbi:hypothetical protein F3J14_20340 [Burkholderia sp. Tr-862]|uniref:hypothetical protein n=1 Tax=Burkholderia sp. Tr-862 TaxID=2608331 RepID=UPI0014193E8B|nr:hypothetical protein [Burkholderia sp. Tr-862]NIF43198.1 hypothetical protein [Burkholderia sp. Tr-862]
MEAERSEQAADDTEAEAERPAQAADKTEAQTEPSAQTADETGRFRDPAIRRRRPPESVKPVKPSCNRTSSVTAR